MSRPQHQSPEEDLVPPDFDVEAGKTPKMNKFAHEISDWLMFATVVFFVVYGVLYLFYEVALGMAHIRWVYYTFLLICVIDVAAYFLARFAVVGNVQKCILILATTMFCCTTLANLLAPATVLVSYELTLEYPSTGGINKSFGAEGHTERVIVDEEPDPTAPQDCRVDPAGWKCGTVLSIRTSLWCMYILMSPKPLLLYSLITILKPTRRR